MGATLGLLSATVLAVQVVLLRLFAIESYHHFAYMVIGVALLGFGAAGTALVLARDRIRGREVELFRILAVLYAVALGITVTLTPRIGYDATQLVYDPSQWVRLFLVYLLLTLPFLVGGGTVAAALASTSNGGGPGVGRLYAWNLAGSGLGSLTGLAAVLALRPDAALSVVLFLAALVPLTSTWRTGSRRLRGIGISVALGLSALAGTTPWPLTVAPTKGLPQVEAFPGARRIAEAWSPIDWTVAVQAPAFRHAPGLSLAYTGPIPRQTAMFVDGEIAGGVEVVSDSAAAYLEWLPLAATFAVASPKTVLVLGSGDGLHVRSALHHGVERIDAVELLRSVSDLEARLSKTDGDPRITRHVADARAYVAGTEDRYDLILLPGAAGFQVASSGLLSSGEDYLNTVEAYRAYLDLLTPDGMLVLTRWLRTPARDNVKTILIAAEALWTGGHPDPATALAFVRSWSVGTLLVRPAGFDSDALQRLDGFARSRMFDVDWPRAEDATGEPFHLLDPPVYRQTFQAVAAGPEAARVFARAHPFDVAPNTDDRPYFGRFLRLRAVPNLLFGDVGAWLPVAEWGYLAVMATLVQSLLAALVLIGLPLYSFNRGRRRGRHSGRHSDGHCDRRAKSRTGSVQEGDSDRGGSGRFQLRTAAYFLGTGFGFVFLEIGAIQRLGLLLGHPVYAAAAVLAALLAFSGLGSELSDRLDRRWTSHVCASVAVVACVAAVATAHFEVLGWTSLPARFGVGLLVVGVPGLLLGMPFPLGLRRLAPGVGAVGWAWAVDGVASVVGVSLATLLVMELGGRAVLVLAAVAYGISAVAAAGTVRTPTTLEAT